MLDGGVNTRPGGSRAGAAGAACGRRDPMGSAKPGPGSAEPQHRQPGVTKVWGGQPGWQEGSSTHRPRPGTGGDLEAQTVPSVLAAPVGPCAGRARSPAVRTPPLPAAEPVATAAGPEPCGDHGTRALPSSSRSPYSMSPCPAARRRGVPGLRSQGQPQCPAGLRVVPAHRRPLLPPGSPEHSRGHRAEGREGEREAPGF